MIIKRKAGLFAVLVAVAVAISMMPLTAFAESFTSTLEVNVYENDLTVTYDSVTVTTPYFTYGNYSNGYGIQVNVRNGKTVKIKGGDVSVNVAGTSLQYGIDAVAGDYSGNSPGYIEMTTGNITSDNNGVQLWSMHNSTIGMTVNGNITAGLDPNCNPSDGVCASATDQSKTNVVVNGNIETSTRGIFVDSTDPDNDTQATSTASVKVYGDVTTHSEGG